MPRIQDLQDQQKAKLKGKKPKVTKETFIKATQEARLAHRRPGRETSVKAQNHIEGDLKMTHEENSNAQQDPKNQNQSDIKVVETEKSHEAEASAKASTSDASRTQNDQIQNDQTQNEHFQQEEKIELKFKGSEQIRRQFPLPFSLAESILNNWMKGGNFQDLPIRQPLAKYLATTGLQKAKEVEKKVLESPITEKVAMKAFEVGMKAQGQIQEIKEMVKKKTN